jgi:hypothetical protein
MRNLPRLLPCLAAAFALAAPPARAQVVPVSAPGGEPPPPAETSTLERVLLAEADSMSPADRAVVQAFRGWVAPDTVGTARVRVAGWVVDAHNGMPLSNVKVRIPRLGRETLTERDGSFRLERIPAGDWPVAVGRIGYTPEVLRIPADNHATELTLSLTPEPVQLEEIQAVVDRYAVRREQLGESVKVMDRGEVEKLIGSTRDGILRYGNISRVPCPSRGLAGVRSTLDPRVCVVIRGRVLIPEVYIDEKFARGGLDDLDLFDTREIELVEVFRGGAVIRVYTTVFIRNMARRRAAPQPYLVY